MRRFVVVCAIAVLGALSTGTAAAQDDTGVPALPKSAELTVKIGKDGALHIAEAVSVPENAEMTRRIPLRRPAGHHRDRVYGVRDVALEGTGDVTRTDDEITVRYKQGTSVLRYTVDGAVAEDRGVLTASWRLEGGWDTDLNLVRASVAAPAIASAVRCQAGPDPDLYGAVAECQAAQIDHTGLSRFSQPKLRAGDRMDIAVELPPGLVPPNEDLEPSDTFAGAFVVTWPVGVAWLVFALLLLVGGGRVAVLRRRASAPVRPSPVEMLTEDGQFASPDGALPGHAGTVLANRMDPLDVAATVLDLAVRNYLWVSEVPAEEREIPDWLLVRRNDPDDQLTGYERAVFEMIFGTGTEPVPVSSLAARGGALDEVREALYADVVRRRWFSRRPDQPSGRLTKAGLRIIGYGVFLTVLLACTVGYAQLGVVLALAGGALAVAGRVLPARTTRGHALARRLRGLAEQIRGTRAKGVPKLERDVVFSRGLAYALALGETPGWLAAFGQLKRAPAVYWYVAEKDSEALHGVEEFLATLSGTFTVSVKLRRTRTLADAEALGVPVRRAGRTR